MNVLQYFPSTLSWQFPVQELQSVTKGPALIDMRLIIAKIKKLGSASMKKIMQLFHFWIDVSPAVLWLHPLPLWALEKNLQPKAIWRKRQQMLFEPQLSFQKHPKTRYFLLLLHILLTYIIWEIMLWPNLKINKLKLPLRTCRPTWSGKARTSWLAAKWPWSRRSVSRILLLSCNCAWNAYCEDTALPILSYQRKFRSSNFRLYWKLPVGFPASMFDSRDVLAGRNCAKCCVFP